MTKIALLNDIIGTEKIPMPWNQEQLLSRYGSRYLILKVNRINLLYDLWIMKQHFVYVNNASKGDYFHSFFLCITKITCGRNVYFIN